jgi:hypothetical protein
LQVPIEVCGDSATEYGESKKMILKLDVGYSHTHSTLSRPVRLHEHTDIECAVCQSQSQSHIATDGQSISKSWCRAPSGAHDQIFITL